MRFFIAMTLLLGCVSMKRVERVPLTVGEFEQDQELRREKFRKLSGKVSFRWEGKGQTVSGNGRVEATFPTAYQIEIRDVLGRLQFEAVSRNKEFRASYPRLQKTFEDKVDGQEFFAREGLVLSLSELCYLSIGVLPSDWRLKPETWGWKENAYEVELTTDSGIWIMKIDGRTRAIVGIDGPWKMEISAFEAAPPVQLGHELSITGSDRRLELGWDSFR